MPLQPLENASFPDRVFLGNVYWGQDNINAPTFWGQKNACWQVGAHYIGLDKRSTPGTIRLFFDPSIEPNLSELPGVPITFGYVLSVATQYEGNPLPPQLFGFGLEPFQPYCVPEPIFPMFPVAVPPSIVSYCSQGPANIALGTYPPYYALGSILEPGYVDRGYRPFFDGVQNATSGFLCTHLRGDVEPGVAGVARCASLIQPLYLDQRDFTLTQLETYLKAYGVGIGVNPYGALLDAAFDINLSSVPSDYGVFYYIQDFLKSIMPDFKGFYKSVQIIGGYYLVEAESLLICAFVQPQEDTFNLRGYSLDVETFETIRSDNNMRYFYSIYQYLREKGASFPGAPYPDPDSLQLNILFVGDKNPDLSITYAATLVAYPTELLTSVPFDVSKCRAVSGIQWTVHRTFDPNSGWNPFTIESVCPMPSGLCEIQAASANSAYNAVWPTIPPAPPTPDIQALFKIPAQDVYIPFSGEDLETINVTDNRSKYGSGGV